MTLYFHLRVVGALLAVLGVSHAFFDRYFGWRRELRAVSLLTRQMFFVHAFFIALGVAMAGIGSFVYAAALLEPGALSRGILAAMALFWLCRLLVQFFGYDRAIWRGDRFRTCMQVVFGLLWTYVTATYGSALASVCARP
jgi:hypothetical protein